MNGITAGLLMLTSLGIICTLAVNSYEIGMTYASSDSFSQNRNISQSSNIENIDSTTYIDGTIHSIVPIIINNTIQNSSNIDASDLQLISSSNTTTDVNTLNLSTVIGKALKSIIWGDWSMTLDQGKLRTFQANMNTIFDDGANSHTHELRNFIPSGNTTFDLNNNGTTTVSGTMDVGVNGEPVWKNVNTKLKISEGKVLTIFIDNVAVDQHFSGQPIYGIIDSIRR